MARIYNRDNVNYAGLIGQAIQNANQTSQLYANKWQPGSTMGQALGQAGEKLQQAGWNEWSSQQDDARARAKLEAEQKFQAKQNELNRDLQLQLNAANNANALRIAELNKATQNEYKMDEYHKGLSLAKQQLNYALRARDMANEGSPEWIAADREAGKASTDIAYYNSKINGADAKAELNKALESGDPLQIAWARARVGELYDDGVATQQQTAKSESTDPPPAANWSSIAKSQIGGLPNQFKNDAEIAQAREQADQITDPTAKLSVTDAIDKIASKGTIEGNRAARVKKLSDANAEYKKTGVNPNPSLFKVSTDENGDWILTWK